MLCYFFREKHRSSDKANKEKYYVKREKKETLKDFDYERNNEQL